MKIAFIGGGNMGEAMLSAILDCGLAAPWEISVSDPSEDRRNYIGEKYDVLATNDNRVAAQGGEVVVLAVKPQQVSEVIADLGGQLKPSQLVLSIMAGIPITILRNGLKHNRIVRVMPNTPAQIGEGISVWTATPEVTKRQKGWTSSILGSIGKEIYVDDEKYLDMATALHGSGPAYFFLFVEALTEAGEQIGLPHQLAQELVLQTMLGSGHLIEKSGKSPAELRQMVTSKGGTTAAALLEFERGEFTRLVVRAVQAAYNRAKELGGEPK
ncbi:MAG: pyrroline-5-carboxylate reductase [Chloroflexi bacterium]|nr:pyrroline-5-carboxylate reductase [Chloroflexota bacterium]